MKILLGGRASGTTTAMNLEASHFKDDNALIISPNLIRDYNQDKFKWEHISPIPKIISWKDLVEGRFDKNKIYKIFIDNADLKFEGYIGLKESKNEKK